MVSKLDRGVRKLDLVPFFLLPRTKQKCCADGREKENKNEERGPFSSLLRHLCLPLPRKWLFPLSLSSPPSSAAARGTYYAIYLIRPQKDYPPELRSSYVHAAHEKKMESLLPLLFRRLTLYFLIRPFLVGRRCPACRRGGKWPSYITDYCDIIRERERPEFPFLCPPVQ